MKFRIINLIMLCAAIINAQSIGTWKNHSNMKEVRKVAAFSEGYWCATSGGSFFADNNNEIRMTLTKSEGISSQALTAVAVDGNGLVWLGASNGIINVYDSENESFIRILDIFKTDNSRKGINEILIHGDTAFVSTEFGLSLIDVNSYQFIETVQKFGNFTTKSSILSVHVTDRIHVASESGAAIQKEGSTNLSNPESWTTYLSNEAIPADTVTTIAEYNDLLIIGTSEGLFFYDEAADSWNNYLSFNEAVFDLNIQGNSLYILLQFSLYEHNSLSTNVLLEGLGVQFRDMDFSNGDIGIATNKELLIYSGGAHSFIGPNSPATNSFLDMAVDNDNVLWVGTGKDGRGVGVMSYDGENWELIDRNTTDEINTNDFHRVTTGADNSKYFLNFGDGYTKFDNGNYVTYNNATSPLVGISGAPNFVVIQDIDFDSRNNTWIFNRWSADDLPIITITPEGDWHHFGNSILQLNEDAFIIDGLVDQYDTKWFSVNFRGVYYFNNNGTLENTSDDIWGNLSPNNYFNGQDVTAMALDNRGEIWVGTTFGVYIIQEPGRPQSPTYPVFSLRLQSINCIAVDAVNQKWVGTSQGVFVTTPDGSFFIRQYDSKNSPLPTDNVISITIDNKSGLVYMGTEFGLSTLQTEFAEPADTYDDLFVYPNPFIPSESADRVSIDGLIENSLIKILTVNGKLVSEFASPGGRLAFWDGRDLDGNIVPSGIYIIVAYDENADNVATSKVAVIRK